MAQYWEDWSGESVGAIAGAPSGWTRRWDTAGTTLSIVADAAAPSGKALRIAKTAGDRFLLSLDAVDSDADRADCEIRVLVRFGTYTSGKNIVGAVGRAYGTNATESGYVGNLYQLATSELSKRLAPYSNGTQSTTKLVETVVPSTADYYGKLAWLRLICSGSTMSVGYAPDVDGAPGTENIDSTTDTAFSAAGWVGVFSFSLDVSVDILAVGVGTNGDTAPTTDPSASTVHELVATDLVVSAPVLGSPALDVASSVDALTASDLVVSSPALGSPALSIDVVIREDYERSSVNLSGSSVSGSGDSAVITIKPRLQESEAYMSESRWLEPSARIDNVSGIRPTFKFIDLASMHGGWVATRKPMFSYDRETWYYFDTCTVGASDVTFRHNSPFTANTIYVGRSRQMSVTQIGQWLEDMELAHPTIFKPAPSAVAFTPTITSWPALDFIADEYSPQIDELGRTIPATPLYAAVIDDGAPDKLAMYVSMGVHAGEDHSEYVGHLFVEKLLGTSAEAVALRNNYRIYLYPCINAPGRAGGGMRGSFTQGYNGADDANRNFSKTTSQLEIVDKPKAVMVFDRDGATLAIGIDFHGSYSTKWGVYDVGDAFTALYMARMNAVLSEPITSMGSSSSEMVSRYYATIADGRGVTVELGDRIPVTDSQLDDYATAMLSVLDDMAADGTIPVYSHTLTASALVVGSPVLGTPALSENAPDVDALTAVDFVVGSPVLGAPSLGQIHVLGTDGLVTGSPVLGSPSITQLHALTALGLTVCAPVLGTPGLTSGAVAPITAAEVARIVRASLRMKTVTASQRVKQVRYEATRA